MERGACEKNIYFSRELWRALGNLSQCSSLSTASGKRGALGRRGGGGPGGVLELELAAGGERSVPALCAQADLASPVTRPSSRSPQHSPGQQRPSPNPCVCPVWGPAAPLPPSTAPSEIREVSAVPGLAIVNIISETTLPLQKKPFSPYSTVFGGPLMSEIVTWLLQAMQGYVSGTE